MEAVMSNSARAIAVVDDEFCVREAMTNLLASAGYETESYSSAEQFLESHGLNRASCIISDLEMKTMSGFGFLQHVRSMSTTIPFVIMTGRPTDSSESICLANGAVGFFGKPVDVDALLDLIESVVY